MIIPRFSAVADAAVLVEFADGLSDEALARVRSLDHALAAEPLPGVLEWVPAYTGLMVVFDPVLTDHAQLERGMTGLLARPDNAEARPSERRVEICYDGGFAPDLTEVARQTGLSPEAVIAAHLAGEYRVAMYGFAPGYAYLSGVPEPLRLPRKPAALRGVPAGSVIIAGAQCLVTTLTMPTGWWIIGRSPTPILDAAAARPFLFDPGDRVRFRRIAAAAMGAPG